MAGHERARRLRVGHGLHPDDAALPRAPHRRAAGAARPDEHAESPARTAGPAGRHRRGHDSGLGHHRRGQARGAARPHRVPAGDGPPRVALRARPAGPREAPARAVPTKHGLRHVPARLGAGAGGAPPAAGRPLPPARTPGQRPPRGPLRPHGPGRSVRALREPRASAAPAAHARPVRRVSRLGPHDPACSVPRGAEPGLRGHRGSLEPGLFPHDARASGRRHRRGLDRALGGRRRARSRDRAPGRAGTAPAAAHRRSSGGSHGSGRRARSWPPTSSW